MTPCAGRAPDASTESTPAEASRSQESRGTGGTRAREGRRGSECTPLSARRRESGDAGTGGQKEARHR